MSWAAAAPVRLGLLASMGLAVALAAAPARAIGPSSRVHVTPVVVGKGPLPWRPGLDRIAAAVIQRTNVDMEPRVSPVNAGSPEIQKRPLLWTTAKGPFPALGGRAVPALRRHLAQGGTWILDGPPPGGDQAGFLVWARAIAGRIFPGSSLKPLPADHTVFKSFYLLSAKRLGQSRVPVYGVIRDGRAVLLAVHGVAAGAAGEEGWLRERLIRLAVNVVLYALCVDYKSDQVHVPAILKRRQWKR